MSYRTFYDITTEPLFAIEAVWLSGGFIMLGLIWRQVQRAKDRKRVAPPSRKGLTTPKLLITVGIIIAALGLGVMGWDKWRLVKAIGNGEARVVEGPVQSWGVERVRSGRSDMGKYHTYERFYVGDSIWFGYFRDVGMAGFHNSADPLIELRNGIPVRATYLYADGMDEPPRIVKLEVVEEDGLIR